MGHFYYGLHRENKDGSSGVGPECREHLSYGYLQRLEGETAYRLEGSTVWRLEIRLPEDP